MADSANRVRYIIEHEFGEMTDAQFLQLMTGVLKTHMQRQIKAHERDHGPLERRPTALADIDAIVTQYRKTLDTITRELSIYNLVSKRDGITVPDAMVPGVAAAIIDHILQAGEMS